MQCDAFAADAHWIQFIFEFPKRVFILSFVQQMSHASGLFVQRRANIPRGEAVVAPNYVCSFYWQMSSDVRTPAFVQWLWSPLTATGVGCTQWTHLVWGYGTQRVKKISATRKTSSGRMQSRYLPAEWFVLKKSAELITVHGLGKMREVSWIFRNRSENKLSFIGLLSFLMAS